jgi:predicted 3-demethylubiquinone-9 3-methyltransferase (glyoxalase superfamily)
MAKLNKLSSKNIPGFDANRVFKCRVHTPLKPFCRIKFVYLKTKTKYMQKITPFLWFDNNAEEAVNFYASVFKNAKVGSISRYGKEGPGPEGSVMTVEFELFGLEFIALNAGPHFKFNEAISFMVNCESQEEVDFYWNQLTANGGQESQCGWLKDKFGLSWQITPTLLMKMQKDKDKKKANAVMRAMMQMKKIDIKKLQDAYDAA